MPLVLYKAGNLDVSAVALGACHGALLSASGSLCTWGVSSGCGELGHLSLQNVGTPQLVESLSDVRVVSISCGSARTAAVTAAGELLLFGCVFARYAFAVIDEVMRRFQRHICIWESLSLAMGSPLSAPARRQREPRCLWPVSLSVGWH